MGGASSVGYGGAAISTISATYTNRKRMIRENEP